MASIQQFTVDTTMGFVCKFCGDRLVLDKSIEAWDTTQILSIVGEDGLELLRNFQAGNGSDKPTIITSPNSSDDDKETIDDEKLASLFNSLSDESRLEFPLCENCTRLVHSSLDEEIDELDYDIENYTKLLESRRTDNTLGNLEESNIEVSETNHEQHEEDKLKSLQQKYQDILEEAEQSRLKLILLQLEEERCLTDQKNLQYEVQLKRETCSSIEKDIETMKNHLTILQKTNIFNAAFNIDCDDFGFVKINDWRIGHTPDREIEWFETNMGLGQVALLMNGIASRAGIVFEKYKIIPFANMSHIEEMVEKDGIKTVVDLPLYYVGRKIIFQTNKFDSGLLAMLTCFKQFMDFVKSTDSKFRFPYAIQGDKLIDPNGSTFTISDAFPEIRLHITVDEMDKSDRTWCFSVGMTVEDFECTDGRTQVCGQSKAVQCYWEDASDDCEHTEQEASNRVDQNEWRTRI